jgi:hypothetical protein
MSSKVDLTSSPFSRGKVFLFIFTLKEEISLLSHSSGERPESPMIVRIALAVALHGVDESALEATSARLLRPPPAERAGTKVVLLRVRVVVVVVVGGAVEVTADRVGIVGWDAGEEGRTVFTAISRIAMACLRLGVFGVRLSCVCKRVLDGGAPEHAWA